MAKAASFLTGIFLLTAVFCGPAMAELLIIEEITGPLSFKSGGQEYVFPAFYAPDNDALTPLLGQTIDGRKGPPDRWQRITLTSPATLQLLEDGRIQLQPLTSAPAAAELTAEQKAQAASRGLWQQDCCKVLEAGSAGKGINSWRVISGTVTSVTARRNVTYVNFGDDWRTDFTVVVPARLARNLQPATWQGHKVEVRGYLTWRYGPSITLSHAAQICLPDSATP